jgi:hypothetical protein
MATVQKAAARMKAIARKKGSRVDGASFIHHRVAHSP